jgi:type III pantothenate kinase
VTARRIEPADALLVLDVGNTRIGMAVADDDGLHHVRRVPVAESGTWAPALEELWNQTRGAARRAVVVGSVNPPAAAQVSRLIESICGVEPLFVRDDLPLPLPMDVDNAEEVGVDRACSAAAAYEVLQSACTVASFGTATTIDCVSPDGHFLGGAILPGLELCFAALHNGTQQLPHVHAEQPNGPFGRNTHDAIVNGVMYGAIGALREIVERYATELHEWPQLVITGGDAAALKPLTDFVDSLVPDLCLMGIALAYRKAAGQS